MNDKVQVQEKSFSFKFMICDKGFSKEKTHTEVSNYINTKKRTIKFNFDLNQGVEQMGRVMLNCSTAHLTYCNIQSTKAVYFYII